MGIKATIKNCFLGQYLVSVYHIAMCKIMPALVSDERAVKKFYKKKFGKELDLSNPTTFAEKTNWYKLNDKNPLMEKCADKISVRDYVIEKGYEEYLNEVLGTYNKVGEIDYSSLPNAFVIKAAHGSHMSYIVKDKNTFNWKRAKKMMKTWLHQDIYWSGREWVYKNMPKRLIVEKYLEDETGELRDFKFYCFNGEPAFVQYDMGRFTKHRRNYYDLQFELMPVKNGAERDTNIAIQKPSRFEEMIACARALSEPFRFARIDFYQVEDKIYFGEITFFNMGGSTVFEPEEYEYKFGQMWQIKKDMYEDD